MTRWAWNSVAASIGLGDYIALWNQRAVLLAQAVREKQRSYVVDVRDIGDVGGGKNDDTASLTKSVRSLTSGDCLKFVKGTYNISGSFAPSAGEIAIEGEGDSTVFNVASTDPLWIIQNLDGVRLRHFKVQGTHAGAVFLYNGDRCRIVGITHSGATVNNSSGLCAGIFTQDTDDLVIAYTRGSGNGKVTGEGHADILCNNGTYQITNSYIAHNKCKSTLVNTNLALFDPWNVTLFDNEMTGATESPITNVRQGYGLLLYRTATVSASLVGKCRVLKNYSHATRGTGFYIKEVSYSHVLGNTADGTGAGQSDASLPVAGIALDLGSRYTISNNTSLNSSKDAFAFSSVTDVVGSGNVADTTTQNAFGFRGPCSDIALSALEAKSTGRAALGMWSDTAVSRVSVNGMKIRTLTGAGATGVLTTAATSGWQLDNIDVSDLNGGTAYSIAGSGHIQGDNTTDGVLNYTGTATWDPPNLANGTQQSTTVTATGASLGDRAECSFSLALSGTRLWAEVTSANTVTVYQRNDSGGAIDLASGTLKVRVFKN